MKNTLYLTIVFIAALVPLAYAALVVPGLPDSIPVHFGADGLPDRMGSKKELYMGLLVLAVMTVGVYLLLSNIYRIDPKKNAGANKERMQSVGLATALFLGIINIAIVHSAISGKAEIVNKIVVPGTGLLFAVIGNYLSSLKPNYFMGLRLPWTLESEYNWRLTHQLAGKCWFWGGLALAAVSVFLKLPAQLVLLPLFLLPMIAIPVVYSYKIYQQEKRKEQP